jgi:hypothetical protein
VGYNWRVTKIKMNQPPQPKHETRKESPVARTIEQARSHPPRFQERGDFRPRSHEVKTDSGNTHFAVSGPATEGVKERKPNQDNFFVSGKLRAVFGKLRAVFDGVSIGGGNASGEAVEAIKRYSESAPEPNYRRCI